MPELPAGTVTFLFTDIEGSTRLWEQHPAAMPAALARHDALLTDGIQFHGGAVVKSRGEGDSLFAVFARASDAVTAACTLQQALAADDLMTCRRDDLTDEVKDDPSLAGSGHQVIRSSGHQPALRVRMALHTGEAEQRDGDYYGTVLNRCARLRAVAHGGQVLLSRITSDLVRDALPAGASLRDLGSHRLKDLQQTENVFQLLHPALPADFPPLRSLAAFAHNLPVQLTSFIGREPQIAEVKRLLTSTRLLTLTGSGGCGKTRLALQVAADLVEEYADGVWLVELAALADPALVPQAVAAALGVREEPGRSLLATLSDYLRPKSLLLLLDNCEHLLIASAQLAEALLRACPSLRILASSREGLGIAGELTYRVPSLSLPGDSVFGRSGVQEGLSEAPEHPNTRTPEHLLQCEAVRLFIERAGFSQPGFAVTSQNAAAVAQVCRRLDGIPLAIELAAARVKALPVEQIAARLDDRFRLLTGGSRTALPRQQTLRALIDWSYDLLSEPERALLRRLSAFAGGWTLEAAEAVCAGEEIETWEVMDGLAALVAKSLVQYEAQGSEVRYRLLETVRQYARDRLLESGEAAAARDRHRDWFLALAEQAEPELEAAHQREWLDRLEREHDNLRAALEWCQEAAQGGELGLRLGGALGRFWAVRGHLTEGRRWLEEALARSGGDGEAPEAARAKALTALGHIAWIQWDYETARARCEESVAMARELTDRQPLARSLLTLGLVTFFHGDHASARVCQAESLALSEQLGYRSGVAEALYLRGLLAGLESPAAGRAHCEASLAIFRELKNKRMSAWLLAHLSGIVSWAGDHKLASSYREEALAIFRGSGDQWGTVYALCLLGDSALSQGELATAQSRWEEGVKVARQMGERWNIVHLLTNLGRVATLRGDFEEARRHHEEALAIRRDRGDRLGPAASLYFMGEVALAQGHWAEAKALFEEADTIDREHGNREGWAPNGLGRVALKQGDFAVARRILEKDLAIKRELGDKPMVAVNLRDLGDLCVQGGDFAAARSFARESLAIRQELGEKLAIAPSLELLASAAGLQGQARRAARLFGAAEALREAGGVPFWPLERADHGQRVAALRTTLGEVAFAAAWAEGRAMSLEEAVAFALTAEAE